MWNDLPLGEQDAFEQAVMRNGCLRRGLGGSAGCVLGLIAGIVLGVFFGLTPRSAAWDFHYPSFWWSIAVGTLLGIWLPKIVLLLHEFFWYVVRDLWK